MCASRFPHPLYYYWYVLIVGMKKISEAVLYIEYSIYIASRPLPTKRGFGVWVLEGLSGAGVGQGPPSRDAANWLSSPFSRSVETRRRYRWLRMVFPRCAPLPSSNLVPFGRWWHARGRGLCRGEPGCALLGGYAPDSARLQGSSIVDEPGEC